METLEGIIVHQIGYKVVTPDMKSLGLRGNSSILTYPVGEWFFNPFPKEQAKDSGGMWLAKHKGGANTLQKYMKDKHNQETRIFKAAVLNVLYQNSYRLQTSGIYLLEEL